jgi:hypothetical protein
MTNKGDDGCEERQKVTAGGWVVAIDKELVRNADYYLSVNKRHSPTLGRAPRSAPVASSLLRRESVRRDAANSDLRSAIPLPSTIAWLVAAVCTLGTGAASAQIASSGLAIDPQTLAGISTTWIAVDGSWALDLQKPPTKTASKAPGTQAETSEPSVASLGQVVAEIKNRVPYFQHCAKASQRRGGEELRRMVAVWSIAADGAIQELTLEGVKDAELAACILRAGRRPLPVGPGAALTIPTPIVFVQ